MHPRAFDLDAAVGHERGPRQVTPYLGLFVGAHAGRCGAFAPGARYACHRDLRFLRIADDLDVGRGQRHVPERELAMAQEIPGVEFDAQLRRNHANSAGFRVGELDAREYGAGAVEVPREVHVVEAHGEAGAIGDEFLEGGALFGNPRGDHARQHHAQGDDQTDAKCDRCRAFHPL